MLSTVMDNHSPASLWLNEFNGGGGEWIVCIKDSRAIIILHQTHRISFTHSYHWDNRRVYTVKQINVKKKEKGKKWSLGAVESIVLASSPSNNSEGRGKNKKLNVIAIL